VLRKLVVLAAFAGAAAGAASSASTPIRITLTTESSSPVPAGRQISMVARASALPAGERLLIEGRRATEKAWFAVAQCGNRRCAGRHVENVGVDVVFRARAVLRSGGVRGAIVRVSGRSAPATVTWEPTISIGDASTPPGGGPTGQAITFTVKLSAPSTKEVAVSYATHDGTVEAPDDYAATSGTLVFAPGQTAGTITVVVPGDARPFEDDTTESAETFVVDLSAPVNAGLDRYSAIGTILNDDPPVPPAGHYAGTVDQGGTVQFDVSPDLATVVNVGFVYADHCTNAAGKSFPEGGQQGIFPEPLVIDPKTWTFGAAATMKHNNGETVTVSFRGTLTPDGTATGSLQVDETNRPSDGGPLRCTSGPLTYTASH
jgi:hypothetical protein